MPQDEVHRLIGGHPRPIGAVVRADKVVAVSGKAPLQEAYDCRLILDDRDTHVTMYTIKYAGMPVKPRPERRGSAAR
jgi:hypothetical protein